ncbi:MAG: hypothetical protein NZM11_06245 [Anaerolineales bacterium]|nr:hypothetical protein [Anaerolineales bacterium]
MKNFVRVEQLFDFGGGLEVHGRIGHESTRVNMEQRMRRLAEQAWVSVLLLSSTLILTATSIFLFERRRRYYLELNKSRLNPFGLKALSDELPEREEQIIAECRANLNSIMTRSTALGARVILTTIFSVGDVPPVWQPFRSSEVAAAVTVVNDFLRTHESENVRVFDTYALPARNGRLGPEFAHDELHLNAEAHTALNAAPAPLLEVELKC